jgi:hypothetical protein
MRRFIKKVLLFLIFPICLALPLDIYISNQLKYIKDFPCEIEVLNDIYRSNINAEIAIFGSSRAWVHFDPKIIDDLLNVESYNFGEDGSNILQQYLRYKEYIAFNPAPKTIILSIDMWTLKNKDNSYPPQGYYPYMLWNTRMFENLNIFNKVGSNKGKFHIPMLRYLNINQLKLFLKHPQIPYSEAFDKSFTLNIDGNLRYKGFRGMDLQWKDDNDSFVQLDDYTVNIDDSLTLVMETFIKELRKENIEVILVYTPEYKKGQSITKNRNEIFSIFQNISDKFNIPFYDYSGSLISESRELFYNVQHLNKDGATIFTTQFINDLKARTHNNVYN